MISLVGGLGVSLVTSRSISALVSLPLPLDTFVFYLLDLAIEVGFPPREPFNSVRGGMIMAGVSL